jgi:hypothetical protein
MLREGFECRTPRYFEQLLGPAKTLDYGNEVQAYTLTV